LAPIKPDGSLHILALEAYDGGSHRQFLDGLIAHSGHRFTRMGLPARKWKWRMRGSALYFAEQIASRFGKARGSDEFDLVFVSSMTSAADLRALLAELLSEKAIVCYFHENQLTYPLADESLRNYEYGFTNITSALAADAVWFNSQYHRNSFLAAAQRLFQRMPDYVPSATVAAIAERSSVMPLGVDAGLFEMTPVSDKGNPPTILWNHRWEYDKNPDEFFSVLYDLDRDGVDFRLIVAGENFRTAPPVFAEARKILQHKIDHFGYAAEREQYRELLRRAGIVVSTAEHEFFGLAVLEAMAAGCTPLLPNRLSYPELLPQSCHAPHLYNSVEDLREKLTHLCRSHNDSMAPQLIGRAKSLAWPMLIGRYDAAFSVLVAAKSADAP